MAKPNVGSTESGPVASMSCELRWAGACVIVTARGRCFMQRVSRNGPWFSGGTLALAWHTHAPDTIRTQTFPQSDPHRTRITIRSTSRPTTADTVCLGRRGSRQLQRLGVESGRWVCSPA
eukprot:3479738-Rhodomonas_salina.2